MASALLKYTLVGYFVEQVAENVIIVLVLHIASLLLEQSSKLLIYILLYTTVPIIPLFIATLALTLRQKKRGGNCSGNQDCSMLGFGREGREEAYWAMGIGPFH